MAPTGVPWRRHPPPNRGGPSRATPRLLALLAGLLLAGVMIGCAESGGPSSASVPTETIVSQIALATVTPLATMPPTATATPRPTPTAAPAKPRATAPPPQPTPTRAPAPQPPPVPPTPVPPASGALTLAITCADAVDHVSGEVCVHTQPGAQLQIVVRYCTHHKADSDSLRGARTADGAGNYTWTWTPDTECRGPATARVTAQLNGQIASVSQTFTVS